MHWQSTPLAIPSLIAALIAVALAIFAWRRRSAPGASAFAVLMLALSAWALCYTVELQGADLATKLVMPRFTFVGIVVAPTTWFVFAMLYTERVARLSPKLVAVLAAMPVLTLAAVWSNDLHHAMWQDASLFDVGGYPMLNLHFAWGFWVHTVYSYGLIAIGTYWILQAYWESPRYFRRQKLTLLVGILAPWVANMIHLAGVGPFEGMDLTPFMFTLSGLALGLGLFGFRLFDLVPIARAAVFDDLQDGVIVLDLQCRIADLNPAAAAILGRPQAALIGTAAAEILLPLLGKADCCCQTLEAHREIVLQRGEEKRSYDFRLMPLYDRHGRLAGRLISLSDTTERKRVEDELRRREQYLTELSQAQSHRAAQLGLLYEVSRLIASTLDEDEIIGLAVSSMVERFGFAEAAISLPVEGELEVRAVAGTQDMGISKGFRQPFGRGIIGWAAETRLPYLSNDLSQDDVYYNPLGRHSGSAVGLPMLRENKLIGVLYAQSAQANAFSPQDVQVFETLAAHLATALENARLYARVRRRLHEMITLQQVSRAILSSLILPDILQKVVDLLQNNFGYEYVSIYQLKGDTLYLWIQANYQPQSIFQQIPITAGISGRAVRTRQPQFVRQVSADPDFLRASDEIESEICIPLISQKTVLGTLNIESGQRRPLDEEDVILLNIFAGQLAVAIENARLFEIAQRRAQEAETLQDVTTALTSALDLQEVLDSILIHLEKVVPYDSACMFLMEGDHLRVVAERGFPKLGNVLGQTFPLDDELLQQAWQQRSALILDDASRDPRYKRWGNTDYVRGWMGVPLSHAGELIGFLTLDSRMAGAFDAEKAALAQAFAHQAATAIENGRLFTMEWQRSRELDALNQATASLLTTLDLETLLDRILSAAISAIPSAQKGSILLLDPSSDQLSIRKTYGYSDKQVASLSFDRGYATQAVRQRKPLLIANARGDDTIRYNGEIAEVRQVLSAIVAPLILENSVLGAISLDSNRPGAFTSADLRLLVSFAATATAALRNAQLHAAVQTMAITDSLTGLYNLRGLFEWGRREIDRARRFSRPLACIFFDLDHFKLVNDTYTHAVGNQVLKALAERCHNHVRDIDLLARYGGEEFVALLPETSLEAAHQVAERLRSEVERQPFETDAGPLDITISVGVAGLKADTPDLAALIDCADRAMYAAKQAGRNCVRVED